MWKHTVRTPQHPKLVPIMIPWRQSFQPVHTWEPEEPNTGMFYSELCNSIPNFAFHIHTLSKGREKKADIESLGHSSAVCKGVVALLLCLFYCPETKLPHKGSVKLELSSRDSRQEGEQVHGAVTVLPLAVRSSGGTVPSWLSQTSLIVADLTQGTVLSHNWAQRPLLQINRVWNPTAVCPDVKRIFVSQLTP